MLNRAKFYFDHIPRSAKYAVGVTLFVLLAVAQLTLFAASPQTQRLQSRTSDQLQLQTALPTLTGWKNYEDDSLGFSIQYPTNWHDTGEQLHLKKRCFAANPGSAVYNTPIFCVEINPWVEVSPVEFPTIDRAAGQAFFQNLLNRATGNQPAQVAGNRQYTIVREYRVADSPAIERIETDSPG